MSGNLLSIHEAARKGITKLRLPKWVNPMDHIEITILERGNIGPWIKLWSPINKPVMQTTDPQSLLITIFDLDEKSYEPFTLEYSDDFEPRFDVKEAGDGGLIVKERAALAKGEAP